MPETKRVETTELAGISLLEVIESSAAHYGGKKDLPKQVKSEGTEGKAVVKEFKWLVNPSLATEEISDLTESWMNFETCLRALAFDTSQLGVMTGETFRIKLIDETPIFKQQYRLSLSEKEILREQMEERKAVGL